MPVCTQDLRVPLTRGRLAEAANRIFALQRLRYMRTYQKQSLVTKTFRSQIFPHLFLYFFFIPTLCLAHRGDRFFMHGVHACARGVHRRLTVF